MIKLFELLEGIDYKVEYDGAASSRKNASEACVTDVTDNSDECVEGCLFACIRGMNTDGHDFVAEAIQRGASVLVCERDKSGKIREIAVSFGDITVVSVENTRSAFAKICAAFFGLKRFGLRLICVTGTNGKTTVSTMICRALCLCGKRAALLGTLGGSYGDKTYSCGTMTTPDPKRLCEILYGFAMAGADTVVMEASSHALALGRMEGLDVYMGVFTNLTPEHLDFHKSMDAYADAKALLFSKCEAGGVFFADDPYCERLISALPKGKRAVRCSLADRSSDYFADDVRMLGENGVRYSVIHGSYRVEGEFVRGQKTEIYCGIPGSFSLCNSLLAFAVLCELGIPSACAAGAIVSVGGIKGRMEKLPIPSEVGFSVYIDFAHTPDALAKLIRSVREFARPEQRIVVLFGCGGDRDRSKRSLMGAIASRLADLTVLTSDNCRSEAPEGIIGEILGGFDKSAPHVVIPDRMEAIHYALKNANKDDIILLCGKGHEEYEIVGKTAKRFSEREIVFDFLKNNRES